MAKGPVLKVVFKTYNQHQPMLLPPSLDELIAASHPVRIVSDVLDKISEIKRAKTNEHLKNKNRLTY